MFIGEKLAEFLSPGSIVGLVGDLGAGKTVLTKGIAKGLGISEEPNSPTFVIMNEYHGNHTLYHFDMYRLSGIEDLEGIGYKDFFFSDGICVVEWADKIADVLPDDTVIIEISIFEESKKESFEKREIKIKGGNEWVSSFRNMVEQALQA